MLPDNTPPPPIADKEVLLKQYELMVETYTKYLDTTLKFTFFSYAVTGAILSYYLSRPAEGIMRLGLLFPILMNIAFAVSMFVAARWNRVIGEEISRVADLLSLEAFPDADFLTYVLVILGVLYSVITLGLTVLTFARP